MALTQVQPGMLASDSQFNGFKNRIINGAMVIDQRNAGATTTPVDFGFVADRWRVRQSTASKFSVGQSSTAPAGFSKSLLATSLSSYTALTATDTFSLRHQIEGFNTADLGWGTADAKAVTLSFKVRSSLTGTFSGQLTNGAFDRSYVFTYTINAANTFEDKSVTIAGDTIGTWEIGNLRGVQISFNLGVSSSYFVTPGAWLAGDYRSVAGTINVVGTNGATFYLAGAQFEKGSTATSFDYRPYSTELALCQRYFQIFPGLYSEGYTLVGSQRSTSTLVFPVQMRTTPTRAVITAGTLTNIRGNSTTFAGMVFGITATGAALAIESAATGYAQMINQTESMSAEY